MYKWNALGISHVDSGRLCMVAKRTRQVEGRPGRREQVASLGLFPLCFSPHTITLSKDRFFLICVRKPCFMILVAGFFLKLVFKVPFFCVRFL